MYNFHTNLSSRTKKNTKDASLAAINEYVAMAMKRLKETKAYIADAVIDGQHIRIITNDKHVAKFSGINWYQYGDKIPCFHGGKPTKKPAVLLYAVMGVPGMEPEAVYHSKTHTAVFVNTNYYGQIKSWALGAIADLQEVKRDIHSIHGACITLGNDGYVIIAPTGTGKSTISMLMIKNIPGAKVHSDDWVYLRYYKDHVLACVSEKHFYIRTDGAENFSWLKPILDKSPTENVEDDKGRREYGGFPNSRGLISPRKLGPVSYHAKVKAVFLLRRDDHSFPEVKLTTKQAIDVLQKGEYQVLPGAGNKKLLGTLQYEPWYNPYLLVRTKERQRMQVSAFSRLFKFADCYIFNTGVQKPIEVLERVKKIVSGEKRIFVKKKGFWIPKGDA